MAALDKSVQSQGECWDIFSYINHEKKVIS